MKTRHQLNAKKGRGVLKRSGTTDTRCEIGLENPRNPFFPSKRGIAPGRERTTSTDSVIIAETTPNQGLSEDEYRLRSRMPQALLVTIGVFRPALQN